MRWRLLRLNWAYGIGELIIVVVGVMIALGFEQWNSDRLDRVEEVEIIERLIADLTSDLQDLENQASALNEKEASLLRVRSILATENARPDDPAGFLRDVIDGANFGWNQMEAQRTTFNELLESGLGDPDIEQLVAEVFASPIRDHINAEINLARFIRNRGALLRSECLDLVGQLESYRDTIR